MVIGHDSGLDSSLKGEQPADVPSGLKILERHIKVKLETDKDWLRKMIQAPAYWIVQEIITTLLDGKLKGLLGEARRRVNLEVNISNPVSLIKDYQLTKLCFSGKEPLRQSRSNKV